MSIHFHSVTNQCFCAFHRFAFLTTTMLLLASTFDVMRGRVVQLLLHCPNIYEHQASNASNLEYYLHTISSLISGKMMQHCNACIKTCTTYRYRNGKHALHIGIGMESLKYITSLLFCLIPWVQWYLAAPEKIIKLLGWTEICWVSILWVISTTVTDPKLIVEMISSNGFVLINS